jgi:hypothetical protein
MEQAFFASFSRLGSKLEVTAPDKHDLRRRGKNDDLDAQNAAHAAFAMGGSSSAGSRWLRPAHVDFVRNSHCRKARGGEPERLGLTAPALERPAGLLPGSLRSLGEVCYEFSYR